MPQADLSRPGRRVVLVTHEFFPVRGGVGTYVEELARALAGLGRPVTVVAPRHEDWSCARLPADLVGLRAVPLVRPDLGLELATVVRFLQMRALLARSVLHVCQQGPLRVLLALHALGLCRPRRLVLTFHGSDLLQLSATPLTDRLLARLLGVTDRVAVLSTWVRDQLVLRYPGVRSKVVVAPGAPRSAALATHPRPQPRADRGSDRSADLGPDDRPDDRPGPRSDPNSAQSADRSAGRHPGLLTLLTVGRIDPRKGQRRVLEALGALEPAHRRALRYVVVGPVVDARYAAQIRAQSAQCGVSVSFAGDVDEEGLRRHYAEADVFVLLSEPAQHSVEGFGLVYLEASANGLPVLAHRTGGVEEAVRDEVTGLLVDPGDAAGLGTALTRLVGDPQLRRRLGEEGRRWAGQFSWSRCAQTVYAGLGD